MVLRFPGLGLPLLMLGIIVGAASAFAADDLGAAPASFIQDDTRLLNQDSRAQMGRDLQEAQTSLGFPIYVAAYPYLPGGPVRDRALALAEKWCGQEPGLVIVFNRGDSQAGTAASAGLWLRYPPDETVLVLADISTLLADTQISPEDRVKQSVKLALQRFAKLEEARHARERTFNGSEKQLAGWFAGVLMVLGVAVWLSVLWWRRHEARHHALFFPEVDVATRLGAPFGGGVVGLAGEEE